MFYDRFLCILGLYNLAFAFFCFVSALIYGNWEIFKAGMALALIGLFIIPWLRTKNPWLKKRK